MPSDVAPVPRTRRARRGLAAALGVALAAAGLPAVGATPALAATSLDMGVVGEAALETWSDGALDETGTPPADTPLHLYLGLRSDRQALEAEVLATSDPASASYAGWRSVVEVGARLNAPHERIEAVVAWFAERGALVEVDPTGSYVEGDVPVDVAEEAFGTPYATFTPPTEPGVTILSPRTAPTALAPGLAEHVDRVYGAVQVDDGTTATAMGIEPLAEPQAALTPGGGGDPARTGAPVGCEAALAFASDGVAFGLAPNQLRDAYGLTPLWDLGFRGQGTSIAVVDSADYLPSDIEAYRDCFGLGAATPITRHVEGDVTFADGTSSLESTLDLQVISAFAPMADRIDWFGTNTTNSTFERMRYLFDMLVAPLDPAQTGGRNPDVVSVSFGLCEAYLADVDPGAAPLRDLADQVLATAAAAGTTYFVATGDDGSSGCVPTLGTTAAGVSYPSTSPWVVAVGGTNVALTPDNRIASSGVWNDRAFGVTSGTIGGGGGGLSTVASRPAWQAAAGVPGGSARAVPDIAAFGDEAPGHLVHFDGTWTAVGGTSASTPMVAGSLAVLNGAIEQAGEPRLGFASPMLYALAQVDPAPLLDITVGDNDTQQIGVFDATPGFDLATGWGSPLYDRMTAALRPPSAPDGGSALVAEAGPAPRSLTWVAQPVLAAGEVLEYRWDLDGDGVVDRTTTSDRVEAEYGADGAVHASVTVRTSLGREGHFSGSAVLGSPTPTPDGLRPAFTG